MLKRKRFSQNEKDFIALRAQGCCEYCKIRYDYSPDIFEIEHIISLFEGGTNELINLAFSCSGCNNRKGYKIRAVDPISGVIVPIFNPRTDKWNEHFAWVDHFSIVEGITPQGRITVELLQLNRNGVVNLRKALFAYGVHPIK
jgi:5-methylcytosine-specific restriction endonuclease McrA